MKKNLICLTIAALLSSLAFQANATMSSMSEQSVSRAERPEKPQKPEKKEKVGALEMRIDQLGRVDNQASQIRAAAMEMNASNRISSLS